MTKEINSKERMQIIADNITYYRKLNGITQKELAEKIGIKPSTMTDYMKLRSAPSYGIIQKIADYFGVKKSDIDSTFKIAEEKSEIQSVYDKLYKCRQRKVLNYANQQLNEQENEVNNVVQLFEYDYYDNAVSAGTGQFLSDVQKETITLPVEYDADFVVPVYGDSMEPEYHSGDYVFVKLSVDLSSGDIGVFELYGDAYIKEIIIEDNHALLHSLNTNGNYKDISVDADSDFRVIGKVVGKYRED
ncbi:XRE family transcriptional regulator [Streptococcus gallolyticus subsp. gallolyticus]|uniref:XRE family transcriptional regulator n=1 Tax=Streptococcus TaxID=1301 RepID=UPI0001E0EB98|nr:MULTISPECIES: XRE family transcriptional regulator [Streptococcus]EFM30250.1 peptidase S24-like protein [Streptococcus gallolyticus subsp. gallolyticus TX20005]MCY7179565.1 XRE family transcriptional regulator [Streptococcus gallolyticus subsp. gallolyticus]QBX15915.1 transcriptional repressor [Streptococcus phage Javan227]